VTFRYTKVVMRTLSDVICRGGRSEGIGGNKRNGGSGRAFRERIVGSILYPAVLLRSDQNKRSIVWTRHMAYRSFRNTIAMIYILRSTGWWSLEWGGVSERRLGAGG
jgi:hypothetical protein